MGGSDRDGGYVGSLLALVGVYFALQLALVGIPDIGGSSEAREAQVVEVMRRTGEVILPLRNGIVPSKPPLFHWLGLGVSALAGGVTEFSARVPSVLSACGVLLCVGFLCHRWARLAGRDPAGRWMAPTTLLAPTILSLTYGFHIMATQAMVDMTYSFMVWLALCSLVYTNPTRWTVERRVSGLAASIFWCAIAGAVLSRGPIGGVLPILLACSASAYLWGVKATVANLVRPVAGWIALLIPVWWYWAAYQQGGAAFLDRQLFFENMQRVVGGEHINTESWWFYLPSLLRTTFPWGVILLLMGIVGWKQRRGVSRARETFSSRTLLVPALIMGVGVLLLSLSSGKRHSYMLPLYPCVALQLSFVVAKGVSCARFSFLRQLSRGAGRMEGMLGVVGITLFCVLGLYMQGVLSLGKADELVRQTLRETLTVAASVLFVALLPCLVRGERAGRESLRNITVGLLGVMAVATCLGSTVKARLRGFPSITAQWVAYAGGGTQLAVIKDSFDEYFDPIFFYIRRNVSIIQADAPQISCVPETVYLARRAWLESEGGRFRGTLVDLKVLREEKAALSENTSRDLIAFRCMKDGSKPSDPYEGSELRDA
jgi:4-amino-4-deoxy-L-arabinose transferase-like glycosyltransferase